MVINIYTRYIQHFIQADIIYSTLCINLSKQYKGIKEVFSSDLQVIGDN